jgi:hypothetical protein
MSLLTQVKLSVDRCWWPNNSKTRQTELSQLQVTCKISPHILPTYSMHGTSFLGLFASGTTDILQELYAWTTVTLHSFTGIRVYVRYFIVPIPRFRSVFLLQYVTITVGTKARRRTVTYSGERNTMRDIMLPAKPRDHRGRARAVSYKFLCMYVCRTTVLEAKVSFCAHDASFSIRACNLYGGLFGLTTAIRLKKFGFGSTVSLRRTVTLTGVGLE